MARTAYKSDSAPRITSRGSVSKPAKPPRPAYKRLVADATPRRVPVQGTNKNG